MSCSGEFAVTPDRKIGVVETMSKPKQTVTHLNPDNRSGLKGAWLQSVAFFRETYHEMKRIRWPGRKEVVNYTAAALLTCLAMGLLVWVFDTGVAKVMSLIGIGV